MRPSLALLALFLPVPLSTQEPSIRLVPRVVDPHFMQRSRMCGQDSATSAFPVRNDHRRSVQAILGPALREIQVHQVGDSLAEFSRAQERLRALLQARPLALTRSPNWAEGTPFRTWGLLATIHYSHNRSGRLEAVGNHLCLADSTGVTWWLRLEAVDVWPGAP